MLTTLSPFVVALDRLNSFIVSLSTCFLCLKQDRTYYQPLISLSRSLSVFFFFFLIIQKKVGIGVFQKTLWACFVVGCWVLAYVNMGYAFLLLLLEDSAIVVTCSIITGFNS